MCRKHQMYGLCLMMLGLGMILGHCLESWLLCNTPCISCAGGVFMCRKHQMYGLCLMMLGLGMILGHCLESWLLCCGGGLGLVALGVVTARRR